MSESFSISGSRINASISIDVREIEMELSHMMERLELERDKLIIERGLTKTQATKIVMETVGKNTDFFKSSMNRQIKIISEQLKQAVAKPVREQALKVKGAKFRWVLGSVKTSHCPDCNRMSRKDPQTIPEWESHGVGLPREGLTQCNIGCQCMLIKVKSDDVTGTTNIETDLESGEIKRTKNLGGGVNESRITENGVKGVFKSKDGEDVGLRSGIPAGTYYKREVAAYKVDQILGFDLVPPTVIRKVNGKVGSHQLFRKGYETYMQSPDINLVSESTKRRLNYLDYILAHEDRHNANFMINKKGKIAAIDNGLSLGRSGQSITYVRSYKESFIEISAKQDGVSDIWKNLNWKKMEQLKVELLDSGLIEEDAFKCLMSRMRGILANEGYVRLDPYKIADISDWFKNDRFDDAWKELKEMFKEKGKL